MAVALGAQAPATQGRSQSFTAGTTAITVDVVVHDKRGKPVTDLSRADFELLEDGVRQDIGDVTLVADGVATPAAPKTLLERTPTSEVADHATPQQPSVSGPTYLALVFERLSAEGRALAYKGALAYLEANGPNDYAGVFVADLSLVTVAPYSNDRDTIASALRAAASRATARFDRLSETGGVGADKDASVPVVASPESQGRPFDTGGSQRTSAYENLQASTTIPDMYERMIRDEQGHASVGALRAVIAGLATLPGRKAVVFFAEALAIPDNVLPAFQSLVAEANRANVSVYTVDSAGLRVHSADAETSRRINGAGIAATTIDDTGGHSNPALYDLGDTLRRDPRTSLSLLADRTGGFLVENTNDLAAGFRRIDVDRRFHYVLTYAPKNGEFDGEWRNIVVKVPARDVRVRARSGYVAVRAPSGIPLVQHELRALADLERRPAPAQIPVRAGAFVFPQATGDPRVAILLSTTGRALTFAPTSTGYRTDFTLLARIRDAHGDVVRKASQPYRLTGAAADRDRAQSGDVLFYRQATILPGAYTLDVVADDALAKRGGVAHLRLEVPAEAAGPRVSDLVIVGRTEKLGPGGPSEDNLLAVDGVQLYPNLGEPLPKTAGAALPFYAAILPGGSTLTAAVTLTRNGQAVARLPLTLAAQDASGRIQQLGQIPLASIPPGSYELTLTISGGAAPIVRTAAFTVIEP